MRYKVTTSGFEKTLELLAKTIPNMVDVAVDEGLEAAGKVLLDGMLRRVPRDTGNLADNLGLTGPLRYGNAHVIYVGLNRDVDADTARYGTAQEYGAPAHNMATQPFIRPAIHEDMPKARKALNDALKRALGSNDL